MPHPLLTNGFNGNYAGHRFGVEKTVQEITRRISWETEAEGMALRAGHQAIADGHALTRTAYCDLLSRAERLCRHDRPLHSACVSCGRNS